MALPRSLEARSYYRCAFPRYEDAQVSQRADRTTGAVYLAGYGVECILKALILEGQPPSGRNAIINQFRGSLAHDFEWLRAQYRRSSRTFPRDVSEALTLVNVWSTEMRYQTQIWKADDVEGFLAAALVILRWADGRL